MVINQHHSKIELRAVSYFSFESRDLHNFTFSLAARSYEERRTTARGLHGMMKTSHVTATKLGQSITIVSSVRKLEIKVRHRVHAPL